MWKKAIIAAVVGWVVLTVWVFVVNGMYGFRARIDMRQIPQEGQVYELLKTQLAEPGRYICNPQLDASGQFPGNQPVYSIFYSGVGHETAGTEQTRHFVRGFLGILLAVLLLGQSGERILNRYVFRVLFFSALGLFLVLWSDLPSAGIGGYPMRDAWLLAANTLASWTLIGLAVAAVMRPASGARGTAK